MNIYAEKFLKWLYNLLSLSHQNKRLSQVVKDIINKDIGGKVISVTMRDLIYEITPFSIINLEVFLPKQEGVDKKLDTENSGNKIVISYEFDFTNKTDEEQFPKIRQKIDLI